jgi:Lon protease-like protein
MVPLADEMGIFSLQKHVIMPKSVIEDHVFEERTKFLDFDKSSQNSFWD